jgi:23S rRNA pseudouridine1911/1915/1917 synthase
MLDVLYEDNHFLIVNKPAGVLVQKDKSGSEDNLEEMAKAYLKHKYNKEGNVYLGIPHRIDRPTSGVIIFCKTSKALERINEMFQRREISKTYWAIVKGCPERQHANLVHYLKRNEKQNKTYAYEKETTGAQRAELNYSVLSTSNNYSLLEVDIITGRHHQIRAQLSHIGFPIKGDLKYGFDRSNKDGSISLHAREVSFIHPVTKEKTVVKASVKNDTLWNVLIDAI